MKTSKKNSGLTQSIINVLESSKSLWVDDMFSELKLTYPNMTRRQMHGCLSKLVAKGRVYHLTRGAYAHPEAYSGVK